MKLKAKSRQLTAILGFSLIEMMVVLTIFGIMTAVVLANFPAFRDKTALDLIAQEIATTIRQAQVYGIGTRAAGAGATASFSSYGIYFDLDNTDLGKKNFYLYADSNFDSTSPTTILNTQGFNGSIKDTVIEKFAIRGGAEISGIFCDTGACVTTSLNSLNILFKRPYPEANFISTPSGTYGYVQIVIQSTRNEKNKREIQVWNTGQIVVNDISTP